MIVWLLPKIALGVLVGGIIGAIVTGDWIYTIVWSVSISFVIMIFIWAASARRGASKGDFALGRVETVQRTGRETNGNQEVAMRLTVVPERDSAYSTSKTLTLAAEDLRIYRPGTILVLTRLGAGRPDVVIAPSAPAEWMKRADAARLDPSLIPASSTVPAWDLGTTTTPGTPRPGGRRTSVGGRILGFLVVAIIAALVLLPAWGVIGRTASNIAAGDWDGNDLVTGRYQQLAIDEIAAVAGSYEFTSVDFYPDYVLVDGLTAVGSSTVDGYTYRYWRAVRDGPAFGQPAVLSDELFDASNLDFGQVAKAVELARAESEIEDPEYIYAGVNRIFSDQVEPEILVTIGGPYGSESSSWSFDLERRD